MSFGKDSSVMFVMQGNTLVHILRTDNVASKKSLDATELEVIRIFTDHKNLEAENERLRRVLNDCLQWHKAHCSSRVGLQDQIEQALKPSDEIRDTSDE